MITVTIICVNDKKVKVSEQPNNQMMKLFSLTAFGFLLATTTAFISKGPQYVSLSELNSASRDNMAPDQFCKTEIDNNEVSCVVSVCLSVEKL